MSVFSSKNGSVRAHSPPTLGVFHRVESPEPESFEVIEKFEESCFDGGAAILEVITKPVPVRGDSTRLSGVYPYDAGVLELLDAIGVASITGAPATSDGLTLADLFLASHVTRGGCRHGCLAAVFDCFFDDLIPHGCTAAGAIAFVGAKAIRSAVATSQHERIGIIDLSIKGYQRQPHYVRCPFGTATGVYKVDAITGSNVPVLVNFIVMNLIEFSRELTTYQFYRESLICDPLWMDVAGCTSGCGMVGEVGKHYCHDCNLLVTTVDHSARCQPGIARRSVESQRAAQLGNALHRLDVITALLSMQIADKERGPTIAMRVSTSEQAEWFAAHGGDSGSAGSLSTKFQAYYLDHRKLYLRSVFPDVPFSSYVAYGDLGPVVAGAFASMLGRTQYKLVDRSTRATSPNVFSKAMEREEPSYSSDSSKNQIEAVRKYWRTRRVLLDVALEEEERASERSSLESQLSVCTVKLKELSDLYRVAP